MTRDKNSPRNESAQLYWQGVKVPEIALKLDVPETTVYSWKKRDSWDQSTAAQKIELCIEIEIIQLMRKENPNAIDLKRIPVLMNTLEKAAKIKKYERSGKQKELNHRLSNSGRKTNTSKNYISEENIEKLETAFREMFQKFLYQWELYEAAYQYDIINLLKSRQIGLTFLFALLAILDAAKTGDNWVFLSASKNQAHIFKNYIVAFVLEICEVDLKGDPIKLWNGATLYFLGTNKNTAQGYHGHLVIDEYQWIHRFKELQEAASGMALHAKWREIYITTPSNTQHAGWKFWDGTTYNAGRPKSEQINLDVSHKALKNGRLCEDGQYRQIITIEDAVAKGCNLFNLEKIKLKYSTQAYNNLLMCQPIDASQSIFTFKQMTDCRVDAWIEWSDFEPLRKRPFGDKSVWIGYDPSRKRDDAACVVIALPDENYKAYRILEKHSWSDKPFTEQALEIKKLTKKYNVKHIGIDANGVGSGVYDLVKEFYPTAEEIVYNQKIKSTLILKIKHLIENRKLKFDAGWTDMALAFLSIRQDVSPSDFIIYKSDRSDESSHADLAWAVIYALYKIKLTTLADVIDHPSSTSFIEFYNDE